MLLLCVETIVKESRNFELARLKKKKEKERKKKEKHFGHLATFWFGTFVMLFCTTRRVVGYEALEKEYIVIKAYKFTTLEVLWDFFALSYIALPCYPYV